MTLPDAYVVHQMAGRFRVRVPSQKRNIQYFANVRKRFAELEGVEAIETNYITGSILILHGSSPQAIEEYAEKSGLFRVLFSKPSSVPLSRRIVKEYDRLGTGVERVSGGAVDLPTLTSFALVLAGGFQMLQKNIWPAGATLLWYAASVLSSNNKGQHRPEAVPMDTRGNSGRSYIQ